MKAFIVSVDYTDILAMTLPIQRKFFDRVTVITSTADAPNVSKVTDLLDVQLFVTDLFYANGADFNKWAALEAGLDACGGRSGWITILDADVVYPENAKFDLVKGKLYSPLRYMYPALDRIPPEDEWSKYPIHRNCSEWAGYSQTFHAEDPVLGIAPWHQINWRHAGGADSFFQRKWDIRNKVRPEWNCLHVGPSGCNWTGRVSAYADGSVPSDADFKTQKLRKYMKQRQQTRSYLSEKLP